MACEIFVSQAVILNDVKPIIRRRILGEMFIHVVHDYAYFIVYFFHRELVTLHKGDYFGGFWHKGGYYTSPLMYFYN